MIDASERVADLAGANFRFYVPRKIRSFLRHQILAKVSNQLTWETVAGKKVMMFDDIPVRRTDALVNETAILDAAGSFADL
jgi:orotate phosphoribosyltransferase-like protein